MAKQAIKKTPDSIESITESKLSRVEMIAREALDILGEQAPDDLRRSVAEVRAQHETEIAALNERIEGAGAEIERLTSALKASERLAEERFTEAEEVWALAHAHAADLATATRDLEAARDDVEFLRTTADSRARELQSLTDRHAALTRELTELREQHAAIENTLAAAESAKETVESDLDAARARIESLGTAMDAAAREAQRRIETLERDLNAARLDLTEQMQRSDTLSTELTDAQRRVEELEEANDERIERIESLVADVTATRNQLAERGTQLSDAEQRSQIARESLAEALTQLAEAGEERDHAVAKLAERSAEVAAIRREVADVSQRLVDRDRQLANLLDGAPAQPEPAEPAAAVAQHADPDLLAALRTDLDARTTELHFLREQMDRADERSERYRERAETAQRSLEKAAAIVRRARRRSSNRSEQFGNLVNRLTSMRIRCENLEARLHAEMARSKRTTQIAMACAGVAVLTLIGAFFV